MHHGVEGQKWGVRKYQNADGTLTPLGRQHYGLNELDYGAKFKGTYGAGRRAYKKERNELMRKLSEGRNSMRSELDSEYNERRDSAANLTDAGKVDSEYEKQSSVIDRTYQKGQKEVDRYLKGKYGETVINGKKLTAKQKNLITTGAVLATAAIAVGGYYTGQFVHETNKSNKKDREGMRNYLDRMNTNIDNAEAWNKSGGFGFNTGEMNASINKSGADFHKQNLDTNAKGIFRRKEDKELNDYYNKTMDRYNNLKKR